MGSSGAHGGAGLGRPYGEVELHPWRRRRAALAAAAAGPGAGAAPRLVEAAGLLG